MKPTWHALFGSAIVALIVNFGLLAAPLAQANPRPLVDAAWLQQALAAGDVLVLDAQPVKLHEAGHIPGAVHVDMFTYGIDEKDTQAMQRRIQSWGVSPGRTVVIIDHGGSYLAPRLYYELLYRGHPPERLHLLDGGMAKWRAVGGAVTQDKTAPPPAGSFAVRHRADVRADLPEVLVAAGDAQRHALVDALEPEMYFGATKFFDRAGHLPQAVSWPTGEFFNADKTFKSAEEIRAMASHLGVRPEQQVYCVLRGRHRRRRAVLRAAADRRLPAGQALRRLAARLGARLARPAAVDLRIAAPRAQRAVAGVVDQSDAARVRRHRG